MTQSSCTGTMPSGRPKAAVRKMEATSPMLELIMYRMNACAPGGWSPIDKRIEEPIAKPIEKPIERPTARPAEKPTEKPIDKPEDAKQPMPQKPVEKPVDKPIAAASIALGEPFGGVRA